MFSVYQSNSICFLKQETDELEDEKSTLQNDIANLLKEKERLEFILAAHNPICKISSSSVLPLPLHFGPWDPQRHYLSGLHNKRTGYDFFQQLAVFQHDLHRQLQLHGEDLRPGAQPGGVSGAFGQSWDGNGSLGPRRRPV